MYNVHTGYRTFCSRERNVHTAAMSESSMDFSFPYNFRSRRRKPSRNFRSET